MAKSVSDLPGVQHLRTMQTEGKRSIPKNKTTTYLDLYMLNKEKERLLREKDRVFMRKDTVAKRRETVNKRLGRMELEIVKDICRAHGAEDIAKATENVSSSAGTFTQKARGTFTRKAGVKKDWKKMPLNY
jgi:hypothetical protein